MKEITAKVLLEQIKNIIDDYDERELSETDIEDVNREQLVCIKESLERTGGKSCIWKAPKSIMDNTSFEISCNKSPLIKGIVPNNFSFRDFDYCPYCGNKIVWNNDKI